MSGKRNDCRKEHCNQKEGCNNFRRPHSVLDWKRYSFIPRIAFDIFNVFDDLTPHINKKREERRDESPVNVADSSTAVNERQPGEQTDREIPEKGRAL